MPSERGWPFCVAAERHDGMTVSRVAGAEYEGGGAVKKFQIAPIDAWRFGSDFHRLRWTLID